MEGAVKNAGRLLSSASQCPLVPLPHTNRTATLHRLCPSYYARATVLLWLASAPLPQRPLHMKLPGDSKH
jgi:hypothetical protein